MHPTDTNLNDYADGLLGPDAARLIGDHLLSCVQCAAEAERIAGLKAELLRLPRSIAPQRDLRAGIWQRIDSADVIDVSTRRAAWWPVRYRLAAAAVLLVVLSSVLTLAITGRGKGFRAEEGAPSATTRLVGRDAGALERQYSDELRELEVVLRKNRNALAPETIRIMEENLRIIDAAIREARAAIAADPNSAMLLDLLRSAYEQKLELLRQAAKTSPVT